MCIERYNPQLFCRLGVVVTRPGVFVCVPYPAQQSVRARWAFQPCCRTAITHTCTFICQLLSPKSYFTRHHRVGPYTNTPPCTVTPHIGETRGECVAAWRPTRHFIAISGTILQVRWPNQQRQSTEGSQLATEISFSPSRTTPPCYNMNCRQPPLG